MPDLGIGFTTFLMKCQEHIALLPNAHPVFFQQYHRAIIQKTPFGIFYTVSGSREMIGTILDLRQGLKWLLDMLKRRGSSLAPVRYHFRHGQGAITTNRKTNETAVRPK